MRLLLNRPSPKDTVADAPPPPRRRRDGVTLCITIAATVLFVVTGGMVLGDVVRAHAGHGLGPDRMLVNALLLNIALILLGWRRYRELEEEVRERRAAEAYARALAGTDPLTGCLNRRHLASAVGALVDTAAERGRAVAFVVIDLDNFKQVNDLNGHAAGDHILREAAARIGGLLPPDALLARHGGDEFVCAVPFDARRPQEVDRLAGALVDALSRPVEVGEARIDIAASLGLARSDHPADVEIANDIDGLLHMADIAMYHAKKQGRNRYAWYEAQMARELRLRQEMEAGIRAGIARGEFVPYYEQQVDIQTGKLVGLEMLARWQSPKLGLVGPELFIPIAEEIGVIGDLSESLIAQALEDARHWDPALTLAVNISPLQLRDPWFAQRLLKLLIAANFPPSRLEVEITESCLHENIGMVRTLVTSLKNQGIRVSLDDFGTGYSSFAQLRSLPFDRLKIDRTLVTNLAESEDAATIVRAIAMLGKGLGMPITAEGIETEEALTVLRAYSGFKGQGYLYGQPMPAHETAQRLAEMDLLKAPVVPEASGQEAPARKAG